MLVQDQNLCHLALVEVILSLDHIYQYLPFVSGNGDVVFPYVLQLVGRQLVIAFQQIVKEVLTSDCA